MKIEQDTIIIGDGDGLLEKLISGTQGNISIKSPFVKGGRIDIREVKDSKGKVLKAKKAK